MVNASTRFNDGGERNRSRDGYLDNRIHAFGPMGVESLTSLVRGDRRRSDPKLISRHLLI